MPLDREFGINMDSVSYTHLALALQDTFEYGVEESTRAAAAIQKNFGGSAKEAFSLIAAGAQRCV